MAFTATFFVTAGMQLCVARETIEDAGALPHSALVSISQLLGVKPYKVCASDLGEVAKPRPYWMPSTLETCAYFSVGKGAIIMSFASWASLLPRQVGLSLVGTASHLVACSA